MSSGPSPARRVAAALGAAVLLAALIGCGGSDDTAEDPSGEASVTGDGLTVPGTTLTVGDTATVPGPSGSVVELTVSDIADGSPADLDAAGLPDAEDKTPTYVTYEMTVVAGNAYGMNIRHHLSGWAGDEQVAELTTFERFPSCQEVNLPTDAVAGSTITSCRAFVIDQGAAPLDRVQFDDDDAYEGGEDTAITWSR